MTSRELAKTIEDVVDRIDDEDAAELADAVRARRERFPRSARGTGPMLTRVPDALESGAGPEVKS